MHILCALTHPPPGMHHTDWLAGVRLLVCTKLYYYCTPSTLLPIVHMNTNISNATVCKCKSVVHVYVLVCTLTLHVCACVVIDSVCICEDSACVSFHL